MSKILSTGSGYAGKAVLAALPRNALRRDKDVPMWQTAKMTVIREEKGLVFFFDDRKQIRAPHIHVRRKGRPVASVWLGTAEIVSSDGFSSKDLRNIAGIVKRNIDDFNAAWAAYSS